MLRRCAIGRWRGYRKTSFVAFLDDGTPIAESPSFRARGGGEPEPTHAASRAHDALVADLVARGWTPDTHSPGNWYAAEFVGEFDAPVIEHAWPERAEPSGAPRAEPSAAPLPLEPEPAHVAVVLREAPRFEIPIVSPPPEPIAEPVAPPPLEERRPTEEVPQRHGHRRRRLIASIGVTATAGVAVFLGFGHTLRHDQPSADKHRATHHAVSTRVVRVGSRATVQRYAVQRYAVSRTRAVHVEHAAPVGRDLATSRVVHLVVSAPSRSSWLEVHRGSAQGPILFAGELPVGQTLRLSAPKLWARFGAAANLSIAVDGRPLRLQGTIEHTFLPSD
jgi:hypothetical protein